MKIRKIDYVHLTEKVPVRKKGWLELPTGPGLGICVKEDMLGQPVWRCGHT